MIYYIKSTTLALFIALIAVSCATSTKNNSTPADGTIAEADLNYPAEGFDIEGSSAIAITIADKVMNAMGGRKNWNETRYIHWNFFGARTLLWDKQEGIARIENKHDDLKIIVNLNTNEGKVFKDGMEQTHPDSLSKYLERGKRIWINDSYWLVMPFKLKDSGVTLFYIGEGETENGEAAQVLGLKFQSVGVTPQNSYKIWVSNESNLVKQWAYYANATDDNPGFVLPWDEYFQAGGILLSGERGDRDLTDIRVMDTVPEGIFEDFQITL